MGSKRFPGKMFSKLGNFTLLEWVLTRVKNAKYLDEIILATSNKFNDDLLEDLANKLGISCYRGSEIDVLKRFADASSKYKADIVVRICADNPFIDPKEIDRLVIFFRRNSCDYAFNHLNKLGSLYSDGFGAEIFTNDILKKVNQQAKEKRNREHVTSYIWENKKKFIIKVLKAPKYLQFPNYRFDVDYKKDLKFLQKLVSKGVGINSDAKSILRLI